MLRAYDGVTPTVAESAYVDERATVIGDVEIGPEASVWPGAVLRGDHGRIVLEERANVQDNATLHEHAVLEAGATVGHNAVVHDATVGERSVVGIGAVVLDDAEVGPGSVVGANSTVTEDTEIPGDVLAVGTPAEVRQELEGDFWAGAGDRYAELAKEYAGTTRVVEDGPVLPE
ncbi:PaaY family protein [Halobacterium hubeiense]|uniref:PaaY family protein n=1 Tax=Halobacterium hubeiense TaxID=1407499 RepID=A0A0U5H482_9EURY|nr:gamma carbonic anhydrase family protein [Halobacterium hubeiense]CQH56792.1 PaaY family protein [Halobacterium hubeiense]